MHIAVRGTALLTLVVSWDCGCCSSMRDFGPSALAAYTAGGRTKAGAAHKAVRSCVVFARLSAPIKASQEESSDFQSQISHLLTLPDLSLTMRKFLFKAFSSLNYVASHRASFVSRALLQHAGWQLWATPTSIVTNRALSQVSRVSHSNCVLHVFWYLV